MCPRRNNNNKSDNSKRQERETRQQEKKSRDKKAHGKKDDADAAFRNYLRTYNLQLRNIIGDGNCLFRSFADQLDGDQHRHGYYREQICNFMRTHREDFQPFIVDQSFDAFIGSLSKDGTYGGNECLVAFSRRFDAKICIHQLNQPVWTVCFSEPPQHEIHIFYHNYEHYSSVRKLGDHSSTTANIRQPMTTCDASTSPEKPKKTTTENQYGACAMDPTELFGEHDIDYILSQLTHPVDRQLIRDTLDDNQGDIDGTIASILALDIPSTPQPTSPQPQNEPIERIMAITGIDDVELVQQSYATSNCNLDSTVESLLKLTTDDDYEELSENEPKTEPKTTKNRPVPNRQVKIDKKKAKKQRAVEKRRAEIIAAAGKKSTKQSDEKSSDPPVNNEQEQIPPADMEFIRI